MIYDMLTINLECMNSSSGSSIIKIMYAVHFTKIFKNSVRHLSQLF